MSYGIWIQYAGLAVAMAGGANWPQPRWWLVVVGLAILGVGIIVMRRAGEARGEAHGGAAGGVSSDIHTALESVRAMRGHLTTLRTSAHEAPFAQIAQTVEKMQLEGTERYAGAQEALVRRFSFAGYASVMSPLATAERWLYRSWSAAMDSHRPEVITSLDEASVALDEAIEAVGHLKV